MKKINLPVIVTFHKPWGSIDLNPNNDEFEFKSVDGHIIAKRKIIKNDVSNEKSKTSISHYHSVKRITKEEFMKAFYRMFRDDIKKENKKDIIKINVNNKIYFLNKNEYDRYKEFIKNK